MSISNLLAERGQCVDRMRSILNVAEKEGRDLNDGERAEYEAKESRQAEIASIVNRSKSLAEIENEVAGGLRRGRVLRDPRVRRRRALQCLPVVVRERGAMPRGRGLPLRSLRHLHARVLLEGCFGLDAARGAE